MIALPGWRALGMKSDEIQARAGFSGHIISLVRAVIEKNAQEFGSLRIPRSSGIRAAHASFGKRSQYGIDRVIVQLEEFLASALPVSDVRFIPHFPQPGLYFRVAVPLAKMPNKLKNDFRPLLIILRRVSPARKDRALWKIMAGRLRVGGNRLLDECNFDQRLYFRPAERIRRIFQK